MKVNYPLDPFGLITLSLRQSVKRVLFWGRLTIWRIFFSIPLITWPAATAAYYQGIAAGLRDPFEQEVNLREVFVRGFFDHGVRSTLLTLLNGFVLAVILLGIAFWAIQESFALNLLAGVALPFLVYWWMCQPYFFPLLVEHPEWSARQFVRNLITLVARHLAFSFVTAFSLTWLFLLSIPLVGPLSLLTIPFLALFASQAYWVVSGKLIPDLMDPEKYADLLDQQKQDALAQPRTKP